MRSKGWEFKFKRLLTNNNNNDDDDDDDDDDDLTSISMSISGNVAI